MFWIDSVSDNSLLDDFSSTQNVGTIVNDCDRLDFAGDELVWVTGNIVN